jgi:hypothetical protein
VVIQPGYAIDSSGREIVLTETHVEPVPPVANDGTGNSVFFDLTVSYPQASDLVEAETREGVCTTAGAVRLREAPVFCWIRLDQVTPDVVKSLNNGDRIRLARAEVFNCQLNQPISTAQRRNARPAVRPYVASGQTDSSGWGVPTATVFGIELLYAVDTESACFRTTPCYMARVAGDRHFTIDVGGRALTLFLDGFVSVLQPDITSFNVLVLIPAILIDPRGGSLVAEVAKQLPAQLKTNDWHVEWLGVED